MPLFVEMRLKVNSTLVSCREFGRCDAANAWRKSTKEADKDKQFAFASSPHELMQKY